MRKYIEVRWSNHQGETNMFGYKLPIKKKVRLACSCGPHCSFVSDVPYEGIWIVLQSDLAEELQAHQAACDGRLQVDEMLPDGRFPIYFPPSDCLGDLPLAT